MLYKVVVDSLGIWGYDEHFLYGFGRVGHEFEAGIGEVLKCHAVVGAPPFRSDSPWSHLRYVRVRGDLLEDRKEAFDDRMHTFDFVHPVSTHSGVHLSALASQLIA